MKSRPQLVIVADDLTGAADTAGAIAARGLRVALAIDQLPDGDIDVLSVSTDCRDASRENVTGRIEAAVRSAQSCGAPSRWYHKVDSAFRGHPGLETSLLRELLGLSTVVLCPALPSQGRTVVDGHILIDGVPLQESGLAEGKTTASIAELLETDVRGPVTSIGLERVRSGKKELATEIAGSIPGVIVVDAETDDDLRIVAGAIAGMPDLLPAGSAGLGAAIGETLAMDVAPPGSRASAPDCKPVLLVVGSAHQATAEQVVVAHANGAAVIRPEQVDRVWSDAERDSLREMVMNSIDSGADTIVTFAGCPRSPLDPHLLASQLAGICVDTILSGNIGGLVLTGGDIAAAVCEKIGAGYLWIKGEVAPAVPWGVIGSGLASGMPIVTKAGSFGAPTVLSESIQSIKAFNR